MKQRSVLFLALFLPLKASAGNMAVAFRSAASSPSLSTLVADTTRQKNKKKATLWLHGGVYDSFTRAKIRAHVTLMRPDSTVIDTTTCGTWAAYNSYYEFRVPREQAQYIIKATCDGYEDGFLNYTIRYLARNTEFELPQLLMKRKTDEAGKEYALKGVVVTGTRIKFAYKGDTLVYNASAFKLPEGSMLDGLVRQLPGAELKSNGDIYINGKKIDYLTLNGQDFFKGNNKVMLDNLPYYTVKNLQVYHKRTERSEALGRDVEKREYVMDVVLKREYNQGLLANVEGGLGTSGRWMGRAFASFYNDNMRLSTYYNMNNINETRTPGEKGDWNPADNPQGITKTHQAGLNLSYADKGKRYTGMASSHVTWRDYDNQTRTNSETFSSLGNILGSAFGHSNNKQFAWDVYNRFTLRKPFFLLLRTNINYLNGHSQSERRDSTFREHLINRSVSLSRSDRRQLSMSQRMTLSYKFPWGDDFSLELYGSYQNTKPADAYSLNRTYYAQGDSSDLRHNYADTHNRSYEYTAMVDYSINFPSGWGFNPQVKYTQQDAQNENSHFRLDWLDALAGTHSAGKDSLGMRSLIPSGLAAADLSQSMDRPNTYRYNLFTRTLSGGLDITKTFGREEKLLMLSLPLDRSSERLHYQAEHLDTIARRRQLLFNPQLTYRQLSDSTQIYLQAGMTENSTALVTLMPQLNNVNPLAIRLANPLLRNSRDYQLSGWLSFGRPAKGQTLSLDISFSATRNGWGTRTHYNTQTGAYTYKSDNINGNWNAATVVQLSRPIDKPRRLRLDARSNINFVHSVDFDIAYDQADPAISKVNTLLVGQSLELKYECGNLRAGINGNIQYRHSEGNRDNFQRLNLYDYQYGLTLQYRLPLTIDLSTDCKMYSRRGYAADYMNTSDLVWNASLSRSFIKGRLLARLDAFDMLHQVSSINYQVNAQGRTETWNNCIPNYWMMHLIYKFQMMPKKK